MRTLIFVTLAVVALTGCAESARDKLKAESANFEFLFKNDASQKELCASMKRLRDLAAEVKDDFLYRQWSDNISRDC